MKLSEISYPQTAAQLNEHLAKTFGTKFNLENFTLEQLEDRRNRIRTKIRSIETMESYDKTNTEDYNKNKMFLDFVNNSLKTKETNLKIPLLSDFAERYNPIFGFRVNSSGWYSEFGVVTTT